MVQFIFASSSAAAVAAPTKISIVNGELRVQASPGRNSTFMMTHVDAVGKVKLQTLFGTSEFEVVAPCEVMSNFTVAECPRALINRSHVDTGDGNDNISAFLDVPMVVTMGAGADIVGASAPGLKTIDLGSGDDFISFGDPGRGSVNVTRWPWRGHCRLWRQRACHRSAG